MKPRYFLLCLPTLCIFTALVVFTVCKTAAAQKVQSLRRVIVDVDPGIDDLEGIVILINADKKKLLKLEAIIVTEGNTHYDYGIRNVFLLLLAVNRLDIPVYLGARRPILDHNEAMEQFYGKDGIGDLKWETHAPVKLLKTESAFSIINALVQKYPNQITYMTLAPMTTLGMTIRLYPEVPKKLKDLYSMGGLEYMGEGEFNVKFDAEAVDIVLTSLRTKMVLVTWKAGSTHSPVTDWYKNVTNVNNPAWSFITRIQDGINKLIYGDDFSNATWAHCDPIVPAIYLRKEIISKSFTSGLQVEVGRGPNRGIITNLTSSEYTVDVVLEINYDLMIQNFVDAFTGVCDGITSKCQTVD